ncbi:predicted protein [Naegleria gruberi]|uniref:Predicted protein n=1 Tax=Naegleria gruberi TaxID=5762 RepID=D2UZS4_NAEGR|nr:uncharacterized protein NAEGRDRAFT_62043 [Naegleria gruberi]EFC49985.1 predicted protein [Naegleria gruberi]|eukprot:XP_002682729.1 predicted protein [Naegleria gruberi strain NEG-M]
MVAITMAYQRLHLGEDFTDLINKYLHNLKERLDQALLNETISYFVRCGPRSPKDSRGKLKHKPSLMVFTGGIPEISFSTQVLNLLIESERVFKDIHLYLENRTELLERNKYNFFVHLIPWRNFKKENELRCFFFKKNLVAITQYDVQLNYPFKGKENICVKIIQKLMNMHHGILKSVIPYENFVMDVEISTDTNSIYIIEFNPYGKDGTTGPVHFNWKQDENILFPETFNNDVHFRFSPHLTSRFEEIVIHSSNYSLDNFLIKPFPKHESKVISNFSLPKEVSESFLEFLQ